MSNVEMIENVMDETKRESTVHSPQSTVETGTIVPVLSVTERAVLLECESVVRHGLKAFVEVGHALTRIFESKLYRERFRTFEDYCLTTWGITDRHARNLWTAAEVVDELAARQFTVLPRTESQARPLTKLPKVEWVPTWEEAVGTAPAGQITASHVESVVQRRIRRLRPAAMAIEKAEVRPPASDLRPPIDAGTRAEQIKGAAAQAQAKLRELQDLIGTADGSVTANVATAVYHIDALRDHLSRVEKMHSNRKAA